METQTLEELRKEWENPKYVTSLCVIDQLEREGNVLVVLRRKDGKYRCHRYFPTRYQNGSEIWNVSVDRDPCEVESAFLWLEEHTTAHYRSLKGASL